FFGTFLGWLGVALTGSDTSSNALFGSLQHITAQQLNLDPILMCAANSAGGVMGKMVDAQSIVVATAATNQVGNEGMIFRFVVWRSIALAAIVGVIVMLYAYVFAGFIPPGLPSQSSNSLSARHSQNRTPAMNRQYSAAERDASAMTCVVHRLARWVQ